MFDTLDEKELKLDKNIEIAEKLKEVRRIEGLAFRATKEGQIIIPEPFAITSIKGMHGEVTIAVNTANKRSNIATYIAPQGYRMIFDSQSPYQFVSFIPRILNNEFIFGDLEIIVEKADSNEKPKTIFHAYTNTMKIKFHPHSKRWKDSFIAVYGDKIKVFFTSDKVLCPEKTDLEIRLRLDRIVYG